MANRSVFGTPTGSESSVPAPDGTNFSGGKAYSLSPEAALAIFAATGTFNEQFYSKGDDQLKAIREAADRVNPLFLAQTAVYSRQKSSMKDMPSALMVMLTKADSKLADLVFEHVIDNGKQLRNFVQMIRSGALGRKSLASGPTRLIARWLAKRSDYALLKASIGNNPSLSEIIALTHPKPADETRRAFYGYLRGYEPAAEGQPVVEKVEETGKNGKTRTKTVVRYQAAHLPEIVKKLEAFKAGQSTELPPVDYRFLEGCKLTNAQWAEIAKRGRIMQTFKNLNSYTRHGVFKVPGMEDVVVSKLKDAEEIASSRLFPYQLLAAFTNASDEVPAKVKDALQDTMEVATGNVQSYGVPVAIVVDVSGSMSSPITGHRKGATSKVRCIDVAALIGAVVLRKNPGSVLLPTDTDVFEHKLNPRDSVMTIASQLASYGGGGTNLSAAFSWLRRKNWKGGLILVVSDMESWVDSGSGYSYRGTGTMSEFSAFEAQNPGAKLVCVNIQASGTAQASSIPNTILNIGGFSDSVFEVIGKFVRGDVAKGEQHVDWVSEIQKIDVYNLGKPTDDAGPTDADEPDSGEPPAEV